MATGGIEPAGGNLDDCQQEIGERLLRRAPSETPISLWVPRLAGSAVVWNSVTLWPRMI